MTRSRDNADHYSGATGGIANTNHLVANANIVDNDFLRVDGTSIEGRTAAETLSDIGAIGASNPTVTLGSNATFPTGHLISTRVWKDTSGSYMTDSGPVMAIRASVSFTEVSGNTYVITVNLYQTVHNANAVSTDTRRAYNYLKYGSNDAQGADVSSTGTELYRVNEGRYMSSASTANAYGHLGITLQGSYVAGASGTQYFTIANSTDGPTIDCTSYFSSTYPAYYKVDEYQGNCLTALT